MMRAAMIALCLLAMPAQAAVVGIVRTSDGQIELHDTAGSCTGTALAATFRPVKPGAATVSGCWVAGNGHVFVVFLDGDIARMPLDAVKKPVST